MAVTENFIDDFKAAADIISFLYGPVFVPSPGPLDFYVNIFVFAKRLLIVFFVFLARIILDIPLPFIRHDEPGRTKDIHYWIDVFIG